MECIPEEAEFRLTIPTADLISVNDSVIELFERAGNRLPRAAPWPVSVRDAGDTFLVSVSGVKPVDPLDVYFFPDAWGHIVHAAEQEVTASKGRLELTLKKGEAPPGNQLAGLLRIGQTGYLVDTRIGPDAPTVGDQGLAMLLLLAFSGGLLLNLMPCVFPVLAVKAMSVIQHAQASRRARVLTSLAYLAGVMVSFMCLVTILLVLKAGGAMVGWGFHLQSPAVVSVLALVMFGVGLSLSGLFEISGAWAGTGSRLAAGSGLSGSFFTGVLATVVATPCTAPFMAGAIGIALLQSTAVSTAVFAALGLGFASPVVVLNIAPSVSRLLPRPGAWMIRLKQLLAFPMYAAAAWLIWVLAQQASADAVGFTLLAMVGLALAVWAWHTAGWRLISALASAGVLACLVAGGMQEADLERAGVQPARLAEPYDMDRLDTILKNDGAVFVNVTAAWCVTCKVNEQVALSGSDFEHALLKYGVTYMKGDWTRQDPELTALLTRFGRAGVPLYILFPRQGAPRVLPQLLTGAIVIEALASA